MSGCQVCLCTPQFRHILRGFPYTRQCLCCTVNKLQWRKKEKKKAKNKQKKWQKQNKPKQTKIQKKEAISYRCTPRLFYYIHPDSNLYIEKMDNIWVKGYYDNSTGGRGTEREERREKRKKRGVERKIGKCTIGDNFVTINTTSYLVLNAPRIVSRQKFWKVMNRPEYRSV